MTLFVSASLLFLVQPMVGKMIVPKFGGTPAVWNTCMLLFQACLLGGYAYAHATVTWLGVRRQAALHFVVLLLPLALLPIAIGNATPPADNGNPVFWLLGRLFLMVGLPFFAVSTTGPLLQRWFSGTGHPSASDPYFLYSASNIGSLLALVGYPLLMEPMLTVPAQSGIWALGYLVLIGLIFVCACLVWVSKPFTSTATIRLDADTVQDTPIDRPAPTANNRMAWAFAAFVPSSLMLGTTAHITTNLAPIPLLWVLPLALYLLTFVIVFSRKPILSHSSVSRLLPFMLIPLPVLTYLELPRMQWITIPIHLTTFFLAAMVCHGALAKRRPAVRHLTDFYLWMSIGGALGGVFNALIAPSLFNSLAEYPIAIVLTCLLLPHTIGASRSHRARRMDWVLPLGMGLLSIGLVLGIRTFGGQADVWLSQALIFVPLAMICFTFKERPLRFALGLGVLFLATSSYKVLGEGTTLYASRNFFGVKRVVLNTEGTIRKLVHGTTNHGMQFVDSKINGSAISYYHPAGPLGEVFSSLAGDHAKKTVGIIGLGAGGIASYAKPGQSFTFYEIDPDIEQIARNPAYFTFLERCEGSVDVVLGDGRISMAKVSNQHYGLIVLDAFSSDAIPAHLLTSEAIDLYFQKLKPDGVLAFHISNKYLDLEPLLGNLAQGAGLICMAKRDIVIDPVDRAQGKLPSHWVVLAHTQEDFHGLDQKGGWHKVSARSDLPTWTDHHSSILPYLLGH